MQARNKYKESNAKTQGGTRSPRVYAYKDKVRIFVEKVRNVFVVGEAFSIWRN